ncbi:MAG: extracellular solute-binding protein, partial [Thermaerobacter sp.]|nr:extracellular solute-binding protein [Thermaerobacter sp.]
AGRMAVVDGTSAGYQKVLEAVAGRFPVGAFAFPAGSSGHPGNLAQGLGFVLFKADSPAQRQAAWTFVSWWNAAPQQAYWDEHSGFAPNTRAGAAAIPRAWLAAHPGEAVSIKILSSRYTVPRPVSDRYKEVQAALDAAFFKAVTGKQAIGTALSSLDQTGDSYMSGASKL